MIRETADKVAAKVAATPPFVLYLKAESWIGSNIYSIASVGLMAYLFFLFSGGMWALQTTRLVPDVSLGMISPWFIVATYFLGYGFAMTLFVGGLRFYLSRRGRRLLPRTS